MNLGDKIGLARLALDDQGDTLAVHLVWLARQPMEESYKVFIHVIDDQGKLLAQTDSRPQGYAGNTNRWIPGQASYDRFEVPLPPERRRGATGACWAVQRGGRAAAAGAGRCRDAGR